MSELSTIRLLVASNLDAPNTVRAALVEFLNLFDEQLDYEGFGESAEVLAAMRRLEKAIVWDSDVPDDDEMLEEDIEVVEMDDIETFTIQDEEDEEDEDAEL
jgi:hypothetical protein